MLCSNSGNGPDKRKSFRSKLTKQRCASCCVYKIQEAFPKAQLSQEHAEDRQRCLTCCKASQFLFCGACRETKQVDAFAASMVVVVVVIVVVVVAVVLVLELVLVLVVLVVVVLVVVILGVVVVVIVVVVVEI
jgi:hypothetical protein